MNKLIIDTGSIWDLFLRYVIPAISLITFIWLVSQYRRMNHLLKFAEKVMKQWGSLVLQKRKEKEIAVELTKDQKTARNKLAKAIKAKIPLNLLDGHTDNEIIAMIQDKDLMKGMVVLGNTGAGAIQWILDKVAPTTKKKKKLGLLDAPTIS